MQFSQCALFTKATPTNFRICHDFNCYINERKTLKTCLTNHEGSISYHIMRLVINSLRADTHTLTSQTKAISKNQSCAGQRLVHVWFKKHLRKYIVQYLYFTVLQYQKDWMVQESNIAVWLHSWYIALLKYKYSRI